MSEAKHTPGPWINIGNGRVHGTPAYLGGKGHGDGKEWQGVPANSIQEVCVSFPASVYAYSRGDKTFPVRKDVEDRWRDRNKANLDLICAAPDMLDALKIAIQLADVMEGMTSCSSDDEWVWSAQKKINAAIAKAEGRKPPTE